MGAEADIEHSKDGVVRNSPEGEDGTGSANLVVKPSLPAALNLADCGLVLRRKALHCIRDADAQRVSMLVHTGLFLESLQKPICRAVADKRFSRAVGSRAPRGEAQHEQRRIDGTQCWDRRIVPVGVLLSQAVELANKAAAGPALAQCGHCKAPPQLEPAPAVHPRQCVPVAMALVAVVPKRSRSQRVFGAEGSRRASI